MNKEKNLQLFFINKFAIFVEVMNEEFRFFEQKLRLKFYVQKYKYYKRFIP